MHSLNGTILLIPNIISVAVLVVSKLRIVFEEKKLGLNPKNRILYQDCPVSLYHGGEEKREPRFNPMSN